MFFAVINFCLGSNDTIVKTVPICAMSNESISLEECTQIKSICLIQFPVARDCNELKGFITTLLDTHPLEMEEIIHYADEKGILGEEERKYLVPQSNIRNLL